jgi:hypothetical protein
MWTQRALCSAVPLAQQYFLPAAIREFGSIALRRQGRVQYFAIKLTPAIMSAAPIKRPMLAECW